MITQANNRHLTFDFFRRYIAGFAVRENAAGIPATRFSTTLHPLSLIART